MKRVLIVAYFFPPISNMGSHRILRFVRHLRKFGWEPVVMTGPAEGWPQTDPALLEEVPTDLEIHRVKGLDLTALWRKTSGGNGGGPARSRGVTTFLNRWAMIPDKFFPWIGSATHAGCALKNISAIYSTSDPLSDHLVARRISQSTGIPYVAEFRDLWLGNPYFARAHPTPFHRACHARLERRVVTGAAAIVGLSRGIADYFEAHYTTPVRVIYNSFEPEDYPGNSQSSGKFSVLYAGAVYSSRSPVPFFAGFERFVKERGLTPAQAEIVWLGESPDLDLRQMAEQCGVASYVHFAGRVGHATALKRMRKASVLLTIQSPADNIHVPGKLFEYIGAGRPILALAQPCEVAELVQRHELGWVCAAQPAAVAGMLNRIFSAPARPNRKNIEQFSAAGTTKALANLLEQVTTG
ncbi:MAG: glycosyltransferase [Verrucomicrobiota bacterium]